MTQLLGNTSALKSKAPKEAKKCFSLSISLDNKIVAKWRAFSKKIMESNRTYPAINHNSMRVIIFSFCRSNFTVILLGDCKS